MTIILKDFTRISPKRLVARDHTSTWKEKRRMLWNISRYCVISFGVHRWAKNLNERMSKSMLKSIFLRRLRISLRCGSFVIKIFRIALAFVELQFTFAFIFAGFKRLQIENVNISKFIEQKYLLLNFYIFIVKFDLKLRYFFPFNKTKESEDDDRNQGNSVKYQNYWNHLISSEPNYLHFFFFFFSDNFGERGSQLSSGDIYGII